MYLRVYYIVVTVLKLFSLFKVKTIDMYLQFKKISRQRKMDS